MFPRTDLPPVPSHGGGARLSAWSLVPALSVALLMGGGPLLAEVSDDRKEPQAGATASHPSARKALSALEEEKSGVGAKRDAAGPADPFGSRLVLEPPAEPQRSGFLSRYRSALERESRRILERDSALFWADSGDEEGYPLRRAQREARRIFGGANGRVLSQIAEDLIESAAALRTARDYVEGVRLDVMSGGGVKFKAGRDEETESPAGGVAASFGLVAMGAPRIEIRTNLPGDVRTRFELPLGSPGLRATFSRRLGAGFRGTLSLGAEDSGADRWLTAGLAVRF